MHIPSATYRLQVHAGFDFQAAGEIVDYLAELGISDLYFSPCFAARPGSNHGYDVSTMNEINEALGGEAGLRRLADRLRPHGMAIVQDIVPNHRAFFGSNPLLSHILENGDRSPYYNFFDIDWEHTYENIAGRLLAPFLGDFYSRVLERGELKLSYDQDGFRIHYWDQFFPLRLDTYGMILGHNGESLRARAGLTNASVQNFLALVRFVNRLEEEYAAAPDFEYADFVKETLWELVASEPILREHVEDNLRSFNGENDLEDRWALLDGLLSEQNFRLSYWKVGTQELNYRRFFSINDLIALRVEEEDVFTLTHQLTAKLVRDGIFRGVRIDHIDGLYDPTTYLERLRALLPDTYVVVEKILEPAEELPPNWKIAGTTGYDFMNYVGGLLCCGDNAEKMERAYRSLSGMHRDYAAMVEENKRNIIGKHMAGDIDNLAIRLKGIVNRSRLGNDLTMYAVRRALVEILTVFPVYRTYVNGTIYSEQDYEILKRVVAQAKATAPHFGNELDLIGSLLLGAYEGEPADEDDRAAILDFLMKLQQYTGSLMAKGVEDTAFYIFHRHTARNEVGSTPQQAGYSVEEFHAFVQQRAARWPHAMNATATHDTKRGEDTRARLYVLSERPEEWEDLVARWQQLNGPHKTSVGGMLAPDNNDELLIYQTMLGAAPFEGLSADDFPARLRAYMEKALREAKVHSSWLGPNGAYEKATHDFCTALFDGERSGAFLKSFEAYAAVIRHHGIVNSMAQTLIKATVPGVPDVYQGADLWDLSLVDPDNRRPVDFAGRKEALRKVRALLAEGPARAAAVLGATPQDGGLKLLVLNQALQARRRFPVLFRHGSYTPVPVTGAKHDSAVAFVRQHENQMALVAATRLSREVLEPGALQPAPQAWGDTVLALPQEMKGALRDVFSGSTYKPGEAVPLQKMFGQLPVALMLPE